jgi:hypothetical protein
MGSHVALSNLTKLYDSNYILIPRIPASGLTSSLVSNLSERLGLIDLRDVERSSDTGYMSFNVKVKRAMDKTTADEKAQHLAQPNAS